MKRLFLIASLVGAVVWLIPTSFFGSVTIMTTVLPIALWSAVAAAGGPPVADSVSKLIILVSALLNGVMFGLLYLACHRLLRARFPQKQAQRILLMLIGFGYFLLVWLAFPIAESL
jgi:hypothetical protein